MLLNAFEVERISFKRFSSFSVFGAKFHVSFSKFLMSFSLLLNFEDLKTRKLSSSFPSFFPVNPRISKSAFMHISKMSPESSAMENFQNIFSVYRPTRWAVNKVIRQTTVKNFPFFAEWNCPQKDLELRNFKGAYDE